MGEMADDCRVGGGVGEECILVGWIGEGRVGCVVVEVVPIVVIVGMAGEECGEEEEEEEAGEKVIAFVARG